MEHYDRIVREPERKLITGISAVGAWRGERVGSFPRRIRIGENAVGWRLSELMSWLESRQICTPENTRPVAPGSNRGRKPKVAKEQI